MPDEELSETEIAVPDPEIRHLHLRAWFARIKQNEDHIYVRSQVDGGWQSVPLSQVPPVEWGNHIVDWLERGWVPVVLKEEANGKLESPSA